uniref:mRNA-decapping enzyme 2 n=1 Tax=Heterorhabditis bacteriophora TaxID=37862 RepID=A0A1I7XJ53_HETBA
MDDDASNIDITSENTLVITAHIAFSSNTKHESNHGVVAWSYEFFRVLVPEYHGLPKDVVYKVGVVRTYSDDAKKYGVLFSVKTEFKELSDNEMKKINYLEAMRNDQTKDYYTFILTRQSSKGEAWSSEIGDVVVTHYNIYGTEDTISVGDWFRGTVKTIKNKGNILEKIVEKMDNLLNFKMENDVAIIASNASENNALVWNNDNEYRSLDHERNEFGQLEYSHMQTIPQRSSVEQTNGNGFQFDQLNPARFAASDETNMYPLSKASTHLKKVSFSGIIGVVTELYNSAMIVFANETGACLFNNQNSFHHPFINFSYLIFSVGDWIKFDAEKIRAVKAGCIFKLIGEPKKLIDPHMNPTKVDSDGFAQIESILECGTEISSGTILHIFCKDVGYVRVPEMVLHETTKEYVPRENIKGMMLRCWIKYVYTGDKYEWLLMSVRETYEKQPRRRVADSISKSPGPVEEKRPQAGKKDDVQLAELPVTGKPKGVKRGPIMDKTTGPLIRSVKECELKKQQTSVQNTTSRARGGSVAARMSRQKQQNEPGLSQDGRRLRNNSNSVFFTSNQAFVNKNYSQHISHYGSPMRAGPSKPPVQTGPRIPVDVLDDLGFRFLINIPDDEVNLRNILAYLRYSNISSNNFDHYHFQKYNTTRICFQVELAHWFYCDFYCKQEERTDCVQMGMREFARQMFNHCDELAPYASCVDEVIDEWRQYKSNVPTYGAILLDNSLNNVLLVQGYYASKNSWGFPKGKVNENEDPRVCAIREVFEETGYDFGDSSPGNEHKIQKFFNDTMIRLYIVNDVPMDYPFAPQTRNEIRKIQWFNLWDLPMDRNDQATRSTGLSKNNFYTVMPFMQDLRAYVRREQSRRAKVENRAVKTHKAYQQSVNSIFTPVRPKSKYFLSVYHIYTIGNYLYKNPLSSTVADSVEPPLSVPSEVSSVLDALFTGVSISSTQPAIPSHQSNSKIVSFNYIKFNPISHWTEHFYCNIHTLFSCMLYSILFTYTGSNSVVHRSSSGSLAPQIAHPIPIQAHASPVINKPVYVAPSERPSRSARISLSETSVQRFLRNNISYGISIYNCSSSTDMAAEFTFNHPEPVFESNNGSMATNSQVYGNPMGHIVQLCEAWMNFKILLGFPLFKILSLLFSFV